MRKSFRRDAVVRVVMLSLLVPVHKAGELSKVLYQLIPLTRRTSDRVSGNESLSPFTFGTVTLHYFTVLRGTQPHGGWLGCELQAGASWGLPWLQWHRINVIILQGSIIRQAEGTLVWKHMLKILSILLERHATVIRTVWDLKTYRV